MHYATIKVAEINLDMMKGCFDTTLAKYKHQEIKPAVLFPVKVATPAQTIIFLNELADKFKDWTKNIRNINIDHSIDYHGIYKVLHRWVKIPLEAVAATMKNEDWSVSTYNKRLNILCNFFTWLHNLGVIASNSLLTVNRKSGKKKKNERRIPLAEEEIFAFLEAIRNDAYCSKFSPYRHAFYYPFLKFIFITLVRNAEAVGLKVKHINFDLGHIEISETLARTTKGTNHAARISKGTKTENVRYLPMGKELSELLHPIVQNKELNDLVFVSPRGMSIDDRMLQRRVINPVLKENKIVNYFLYQTFQLQGETSYRVDLSVPGLRRSNSLDFPLGLFCHFDMPPNTDCT